MTRWQSVAALVVLGVGWGSTQPLGKIAASSGHPPFFLILGQLAVCVVVLGALTLVRGKGLVLSPRAIGFYGAVAVLGTLVPNLTFYISVYRLPAGIMSIVISTVPLMALPLNLALGADRFEGKRLLGLLLGLAGVAIIAAPGAGLYNAGMVAFLPVALIGPLFYALEGTFVARHGMAGMDPVQAMFGASLMGFLLCLPLVWLTGSWVSPLPGFGRPEAALVFSSALHALLYAGYVGLAAKAGAVFASQTSYIVTAAGLIWAMLLLGERFSPLIFLAVAVMLVGLTLVRPRAKAAIAA
ncbi:EamA family transporter [bacterium]|nr:EamA family transporter [bacterium]